MRPLVVGATGVLLRHYDVGGLQNLRAKKRRVVGVIVEETLDNGTCLGGVVVAQKCLRPVGWEEDVARALYLRNLLKARVDILQCVGLSRVVVKELQ